MVVGTLADIDQLLLAVLGILTVLDGLHAPALGGDNLHALAIGEGGLVVGDAENAVGSIGSGCQRTFSDALPDGGISLCLTAAIHSHHDALNAPEQGDNNKEAQKELELGRMLQFNVFHLIIILPFYFFTFSSSRTSRGACHGECRA